MFGSIYPSASLSAYALFVTRDNDLMRLNVKNCMSWINILRRTSLIVYKPLNLYPCICPTGAILFTRYGICLTPRLEQSFRLLLCHADLCICDNWAYNNTKAYRREILSLNSRGQYRDAGYGYVVKRHACRDESDQDCYHAVILNHCKAKSAARKLLMDLCHYVYLYILTLFPHIFNQKRHSRLNGFLW